jgi:hypothetical protein
MTDQQEAGAEEAPDKLVTRDELIEIIKQETGLRFTPGTMAQICAPSRGEGPPVEGYLGKRPIYSARKGVAWARSRLRPKPHTVHPAYPRRAS